MAGIDLLRRGARRQPPRGAEKSPGVAALLALVPGLGAAYNGQNIKALVHFAVTVGLWQVADILHLVLFGIGGVAFYFYSIFDAHRSALRLRAGEDLSAEEERLKKLLRENTHIWGSVLVGVGLLSILNLFVSDWYLRQLWPALLIGGGIYLLYYYRHRRTSEPPEFHYRTPPPSVIPLHYEGSSREYARSESGRYDK